MLWKKSLISSFSTCSVPTWGHAFIKTEALGLYAVAYCETERSGSTYFTIFLCIVRSSISGTDSFLPAVLFGNNCNMIMLFYMITHSIKAGHIPIASHFCPLKKMERPQYLFHLLRCTISPYISSCHKNHIPDLESAGAIQEGDSGECASYRLLKQMYTGLRPNSTRSVQ